MAKSARSQSSTSVMRSVKRNRAGLCAIPVVAVLIVGAYFAAVEVRPIIDARLQISSLREMPPEDEDDKRNIRVRLLAAGKHAAKPCAELAVDTTVSDVSRRIAMDILLELDKVGKADDATVCNALADIACSGANSTELRTPALRELAARKDARLLEALPDLARSADPAYRIEVVGAASQFDDKDARHALMSMTDDRDTEVRAAAISAVVKIARKNPRASVSDLVERLRDASPVQARRIISILARAIDHTFDLGRQWERDYYGGLRQVEEELKELAYILPPDGTELIEHSVRSAVTNDFHFVAAQKANGQIVVTLSRASGEPVERLLGRAEEFAKALEQNPAIESARGYERSQFLKDETGQVKAHFWILIDLRAKR